MRPMSPYAVTKLATEQYPLAYQQSYGMETLAFRFFNVFGPRQRAGHVYAAVIPTFIDALLRGEPLPDQRRRHQLARLHLRRHRLPGAARRRASGGSATPSRSTSRSARTPPCSSSSERSRTRRASRPRCGTATRDPATSRTPRPTTPCCARSSRTSNPWSSLDGLQRHPRMVQGDLVTSTLVVVGQGYVGLPMALRAAESGLKVVRPRHQQPRRSSASTPARPTSTTSPTTSSSAAWLGLRGVDRPGSDRRRRRRARVRADAARRGGRTRPRRRAQGGRGDRRARHARARSPSSSRRPTPARPRRSSRPC